MTKYEDIIGVHYGHDATVVLLRDGVIVEAMSEERLSRQKKHIGFPRLALAYLKQKYALNAIEHAVVVGIEPSSIIEWTKEDNERNRKQRERNPDWFLRGIVLRFGVLQFISTLRTWWIEFRNSDSKHKRTVERVLNEELPGTQVTYIDHHLAHAWATVPFYDSYDKKRIIMTLDGEGDGSSGLVGIYENGTIIVKHRFHSSESLGLLYSSIVDVLGMARNEHEFKVMGLAPYAKQSAGEVAYESLKQLLYLDTQTLRVHSKIDTRKATGYLVAHNINTNHRFDALAYGVQKLAEEFMQQLVIAAIRKYQISDIAVGGGVFMNVKANQHILNLQEVTSLVVTPSCGDESLAIGAAVYGYALQHGGDLHKLTPITKLYLGSAYTDEEIKRIIDEYAYTKECVVTYFNPDGVETIEMRIAALLAENRVVGRLKGRSEWGARALGNRSILANPSSRENVKVINEMIKGRDFWMPFATSILEEESETYLVNPKRFFAPYMAITFETTQAAERDLSAALHPYDLTSRPQVVRKEMNPEYHALIRHFKERTGIGGVLNTSFNLHGEPNVETPEDALRTFEHSGLQYVALGNYLVAKNR